MLGSDGRVAEQGSFKELSSRKDGAFTKLMEWQMSGGETPDYGKAESTRNMAVSVEGGRGLPTEKEEIQLSLDSGAEEGEGNGEDDGAAETGKSESHEVVKNTVQRSGKT